MNKNQIKELLSRWRQATQEPTRKELAQQIKNTIPDSLPIISQKREALKRLYHSKFVRFTAAAVFLIACVTILQLDNSTNGYAWADVVKASSEASTMHISFTHEYRDVDRKESMELWIDRSGGVVMSKIVSSKHVSVVRMDLINRLEQRYNLVNHQLSQGSVGEEMVNIFLSDSGPLDFILQLFSKSKRLPKTLTVSDAKMSTVGDRSLLTFHTDLPDDEREYLSMEVEIDSVTHRPLKFKVEDEAEYILATVDYPDSVPTTFADLGIDINQAIPPQLSRPKKQRPTIRLILRDQQGQIIQGSVANHGQSVETDQDGICTIPEPYWNPDKTKVIFAFASDRNMAIALRLRPEDVGQSISVNLEPMARISGRLVDQKGQGLSEAKVQIYILNPNGGGMGLGSPPWKTEIDAQGNFLISELPIGVNYYLEAEKPGFQTLRDLNELRAGQQLDVGNIIVKPTHGFESKEIIWNGTVEGRVVNENGKPIWGARVHTQFVGSDVIQDKTNRKGEFKLEGLPADKEIDIRIYYGGYGHNHIVIALGEAPPEQYQITPQGYKWIGKPAPPLYVDKWINCEPFLLEEYQGKVVLLQVTAYMGQTEPGHYEPHSKKLAALNQEYKDRGLAIIVIHQLLDKGWPGKTTQEDIKDFILKNNIDYPVGIDQHCSVVLDQFPEKKGWVTGATHLIYDVKATPAHYLIDKKGILRCSPTEQNMDKLIKQLLDED